VVLFIIFIKDDMGSASSPYYCDGGICLDPGESLERFI